MNIWPLKKKMVANKEDRLAINRQFFDYLRESGGVKFSESTIPEMRVAAEKLYRFFLIQWSPLLRLHQQEHLAFDYFLMCAEQSHISMKYVLFDEETGEWIRFDKFENQPQ